MPAIVINPGAFTHYAWAIHDALAAFDGPVVELHLSDPETREPWRHLSVVAPVAAATVKGLGGRRLPQGDRHGRRPPGGTMTTLADLPAMDFPVPARAPAGRAGRGRL